MHGTRSPAEDHASFPGRWPQSRERGAQMLRVACSGEQTPMNLVLDKNHAGDEGCVGVPHMLNFENGTGRRFAEDQ
eukprot:1873864-Amphidinium_carterae.1